MIKKMGWKYLFSYAIWFFLIGGSQISLGSGTCFQIEEDTIQGIKISTFDVDATPPIGSQLAYDPMLNSGDLSLRARGIVLLGADKPIVLCAVDWLGISNESQDAFKNALAIAANTDPQHVAIHTTHVHDAPICDFGAEKILLAAKMSPCSFEGGFARELILKLQVAVKNSLSIARPVTHIGFGEALVFKVASNRRILNDQGKVDKMRGSSCKDSALIIQPEGVIDPMVSVISFWDHKKPLAVLSFYAVHPQSYYLTKVTNPDFPGIARFYRQLAVPDALHIHFNGAGGNIAAGKYNDGSHENREILAGRLADGMKRAWESSEIKPVSEKDMKWETEPVGLPVADNIDRIGEQMKLEGNRFLTNNMGKLAWMKRRQVGIKIDLGCLSLGEAKILFMPGELFVEYQLAAKAMRPDLIVAMAAYGDYGPFYIGTKEAYSQGGYEIKSSGVTEEAEGILLKAMRKLLKDGE